MREWTRVIFLIGLFIIPLAACHSGQEYTILDPDGQALMDAATHTSAIDGNQVELLVDGAESYPKRMELLRSATQHINLQTLLFEDNETGWDTAWLLSEKALSGVEVNVILDFVSQIMDSTMEITYILDCSGVNVVRYNPTGYNYGINSRMHEKILVVDGRAAVVGGMNIGDKYFMGGVTEDGWRDTDVFVRGPVVADIQKVFLDNWDDFRRKENPFFWDEYSRFYPDLRPAGEISARFVGHAPRWEDYDGYANYIAAISLAKDYIYLENAYFIPPPALRERLIGAARRGLEVLILTNSAESSDIGAPLYYASLYHFEELLANDVRLFLRKGTTLHSKLGTIDGQWSTIGSFNLDPRSAFTNSECNLNIHGADFALQVEDMFFQDLRPGRAEEIGLDFVQNLSPTDRLLMELFHAFEDLM